jgi:anionic cell wall polymer biosynthesis LytR-Cps2A-Psr (LCP) family protein
LKKSFGKMFIKGFLKSFFIVVILLGVGVLGYKATIHFWQAPQEEAILAYQNETIPERITKASMDSVSRNLIYCYDEETNEITKIVLEIFHSENKQLTYLTIPMRTQLNISDSLYRKLTVVNPETPQILQLTAMNNYLEGEAIFEYGVLIIEDLLGIKISYYTAMAQSIYETIFESTYIKEANDKDDTSFNDGYATLPVETFAKQYKKTIKAFKDSEDIKEYIEKLYPDLKTNLPLSSKLKYLDGFSEIQSEHVSFELIKGNNKNSAFYLDVGPAAKQLNDLINAKGTD